LDRLIDNLPDIIGTAAQSNLGILALLSVALSILAYVFFSGASEKARVGIFVLLFLGVAGFGAAMFRVNPAPEPRVRPPLPPGIPHTTQGSSNVEQRPPLESGPPSKSSQSRNTPVQRSPSGSTVQIPPPKQWNIITHNTAKNLGNGQWRWTIFLVTDAEIHSEIDCVEYTLHPTFPDPAQRVCTPSNDFALTGTGWGTFEVEVRVILKDGTEKRLRHMLKFS